MRLFPMLLAVIVFTMGGASTCEAGCGGRAGTGLLKRVFSKLVPKRAVVAVVTPQFAVPPTFVPQSVTAPAFPQQMPSAKPMAPTAPKPVAAVQLTAPTVLYYAAPSYPQYYTRSFTRGRTYSSGGCPGGQCPNR